MQLCVCCSSLGACLLGSSSSSSTVSFCCRPPASISASTHVWHSSACVLAALSTGLQLHRSPVSSPTHAALTRVIRRSHLCASRLSRPSVSFPAVFVRMRTFGGQIYWGLGCHLTLCKLMLGYRSVLLGFYSGTWLAVCGGFFFCCWGCGPAVLVGCRLALLLVC